MVDEIPPRPHEELAERKMRALLDRLQAEFPHASADVLKRSVQQAAALLWPGMNRVALFASAAMLVGRSLDSLSCRGLDSPP